MSVSTRNPRTTLIARLGWAGFTFFLLKGLLWLAAPILIARFF